jgi:hypothetical protein
MLNQFKPPLFLVKELKLAFCVRHLRVAGGWPALDTFFGTLVMAG